VSWTPAELSTHQDHVVAHVIDATVLGYFIHDETLHLLLNIGFVWTIYLDGQMVLLPQRAAINELEVETELRQQLTAEADVLDAGEDSELKHWIRLPVECVIEQVEVSESESGRRIVLGSKSANVSVETSLTTAEITVSVAT
jgi:hypothetical protein